MGGAGGLCVGIYERFPETVLVHCHECDVIVAITTEVVAIGWAFDLDTGSWVGWVSVIFQDDDGKAICKVLYIFTHEQTFFREYVEELAVLFWFRVRVGNEFCEFCPRVRSTKEVNEASVGSVETTEFNLVLCYREL